VHRERVQGLEGSRAELEARLRALEREREEAEQEREREELEEARETEGAQGLVDDIEERLVSLQERGVAMTRQEVR
jgi:hypothetical protein